MAMGVTIDPSYAFPLPIFGINYLDFEFGGPDSQLALLFAGVLAAGNIQRPKLGSTPLDASVDFFGIAVPSSDRVYDAERRARSRARADLAAVDRPQSRLAVHAVPESHAQYQFRFDGFVRDRTTAEDFAVPSSTVTNGIGAAWEYRRGGYSLLLNGAWFAARPGSRGDCRAPDALGQSSGQTRPTPSTARSLSRDFYFNVFHKIHLNAAWFGGSDLDRFAKYQFGMFDDTRIHGVPASGVRFDELAMARGIVFAEHLRAVPARSVSRAGLGARPSDRRRPGSRFRASASRSTSGRRRTRFCAPTSAGACCRTGTGNVGSTTLQIMILKPLG